jgi:anti-sigma B factor antagonist
MSPPDANLAVHEMADARVVEFARADLTDAALIQIVGDEIYEVIKGVDAPKLVVDFNKVERLSSATLGMLIALNKVVGKQNGQLRLANVNKEVMEIFKITKLDGVLKICKSTDKAISSFK